jgi:hypothetical protein
VMWVSCGASPLACICIFENVAHIKDCRSECVARADRETARQSVRNTPYMLMKVHLDFNKKERKK